MIFAEIDGTAIIVAFLGQLFVLLTAIVTGYFLLRNKQLDHAAKQDQLLVKVDGRLTELLTAKEKEKEDAVAIAQLEGEKVAVKLEGEKAVIVAEQAGDAVVATVGNGHPQATIADVKTAVNDATSKNVEAVKKDVGIIKTDVKKLI